MIPSETISHISRLFSQLPLFSLLSFIQVLPLGNLSGVTVYGLKVWLSSHKLWCWTKSELLRISPLTTLLLLDFTDSFTFLTGFIDGKKTVSSAGPRFWVELSKLVCTLTSCTGTMSQLKKENQSLSSQFEKWKT
jgi:hypothetical protein